MKSITKNPWKLSIPIVGSMIFFTFLLIGSGSSISTIPSAEAKYVFSKKWGSEGSGNGQFKLPTGITVDSSGNAYVADGENNRIQKFKLASPCPSGTNQITPGVCFVRSWGNAGTGNGQFNFTADVAVDSSGKVYVLDNFNRRVQVFKGSGEFITKWGYLGSGDGQFDNPLGIAIDSSGSVYVADTKNDRIQKFKLADPCPVGTTQVGTGACFVTKWGTLGHANGQFDKPWGIDVDSSGLVYVADAGNNRIQVFTNNGIFINTWGSPGSGDGQFEIPTGIDVDRYGFVYVADTTNFRIEKFQLSPNPCPAGTLQIAFEVCFVTKWGQYGTGNGQFEYLWGIETNLNRVFASDSSISRIQEFYWKTDVGGPGGGGTSPNIAVK